MAYRDDIDALAARHAALSADVQARERERDETGLLLAEAKARAAEQARLEDVLAGGPARRRRKRMTIAAALAIAFALVGGIAFAVHHRRHHHRDLMSPFVDELCACTDMPCVESVEAKFVKLAADDSAEPGEPTEEELALARRAVDCMQKIAPALSP